MRLSVIIPVAPGDMAWQGLLPQLKRLPAGSEIWVVATAHQDVAPVGDFAVHWLTGPQGRARQMNLAAQAATREYLWFLHADSRLENDAVEKLAASVAKRPRALHFFRLAFAASRLPAVALNAWAANLRARFLGMPFGDQGFCIPRDLFFELGGFREDVPYGEDHLLAWAARHARVPLSEVPSRITTSPRKYELHGWGKTTARHVSLTLSQALPEWRKEIGRRLKGKN